MTLFFSLLPLYLLGNLHCMGMCGPLVMLLGQHHYRYFYFLGRLLSFSAAGFIAGEMGAVLHTTLKHYFLAEIVSIGCGFAIMAWGFYKMRGREGKVRKQNQPKMLNGLHRWVSTLLLKDRVWPTFLFGFFTIALPCGQTLVVFSACALAGDAWVGLGNGFAFALLTSPSLVAAMHALTFFRRFKHYDQAILGGCSVFVGLLSCCRGFAEIGWIKHWVLNPEAAPLYHLVVF